MAGRRRTALRLLRSALLLAALAGAVSPTPTVAAEQACPDGNLVLLDGARVVSPPGAERLIDGRFAPEGSDPTREGLRLEGELRVDLGSPRTVRAVMIQAGHDDVYTLEGSIDGAGWEPLAVAGARGMSGLRSRAVRLSRAARVRWLRVTATGGDGEYHLSQLAAWCEVPDQPPTAEAPRPTSRGAWIRAVKAVIAILGLGLLAWGALLRRAGRPETARRGRDAALVVLGLAAGLAWWNFGTFNSGRHLHVWDQFHYFLGGKYFPELGYDLLYECATLADLEDGLASRLRSRTIRDMASNRSVPALTAVADPDRCKSRFDDARWTFFKRDVAWFRGQLHPELWERIFLDHGYNAPPTWTILGGTVTRLVPANDGTMFALSLLDPLLLLLMWGTVVWAFGWRTACVGLLWWGTNQMAHFGWTGGGLLRQDWLVLTVVGICLVRRRHGFAGGFALGYATLLRVFPGFVVAGLLLQVVARSVRERRFTVTREQTTILAGCLAAVVILVPLSAATADGQDSWRAFVDNSRANLRATGVNMVGLMSALTYDHDLRKEALFDRNDEHWEEQWREANRELFRQRRSIHWLLIAAFLPLVAWAARREETWAALVLGIGLIPIGVFVACYYYGFLLCYGLLHRRLGDAVGALLCALSIATHAGEWIWGSRMQMDTRFAWNSVATVLVVLAITIVTGRLAARPGGSAGGLEVSEN